MPFRESPALIDPDEFWFSLEPLLADCDSVEAAAQLFCERFYATYSSYAALVRVFVTLPYAALEPDDRGYVDDFMQSISDTKIAATTPVLGLAGTYGIERAWCARETSRDHRAIPLLSEEFVAEIPMIARLLTEIGFAAGDLRVGAWQFVVRDGEQRDGLFFVGDARTTTDERGRRIIPSIDFVERYGIRTVFGFGGSYTESPSTYFTAIVFSRVAIDRTVATQFLGLAAKFKAVTAKSVRRAALFNRTRR